MARSSTSFSKGHQHSPEALEKIREATKKQWSEGRARGFSKGHRNYLTEESRKKLSEALRKAYAEGRKLPPRGRLRKAEEGQKSQPRAKKPKKPKQPNMTVKRYYEELQKQFYERFYQRLKAGEYSKEAIAATQDDFCIDDEQKVMI